MISLIGDISNTKNKYKTNRLLEEKNWWLPHGRWRGMGEIDKGDSEVQTSSYNINKSQR